MCVYSYLLRRFKVWRQETKPKGVVWTTTKLKNSLDYRNQDNFFLKYAKGLHIFVLSRRRFLHDVSLVTR